MSDISKESTNSNKRRIHEIDDTIEYLSHEVKKLNDFVFKTELESALMTAKLKREKVKALTAVAKSQVILADMEILIAESDLYSDLIRMKNRKKIKLDRKEGKTDQSQRATQDKPVSTTKCRTTKSAEVQTTKTMSAQKKKKKTTSSKSKSPADISSDETVIVETLPESKSASIIESSQYGFSAGLLNQQTSNTSDSEISLSSSIKAEFNTPYNKTDTPVSETNTSNKKSDKKIESKSKSSSHSQLSSIKTKTVADINKTLLSPSINICKDSSYTHGTPKHSHSSRQKHRILPYDKKLTPSTSTYIPARHVLPMIVTQPKIANVVTIPSSSILSPSLYLNSSVSQANLYQSPSMNSPNCVFYASKQ